MKHQDRKRKLQKLKIIETNLKDRIQKVTNQVKVMDIKTTGTTHDVLEKWKNRRSKQWKQKDIANQWLRYCF